jgi:hypothetical protein
MDWVKVTVRHSEFDFSSASDSVFRTWIRMMCYVAVLERIPTEAQLSGHLGEKNYEDLKTYLNSLGNGVVTRYIMDKVLEDVERVQHRRIVGKERQVKHRKDNATCNALHNAGVTRADKIREDKIREDKKEKKKEPTHPPFVFLEEKELQGLYGDYGKTIINEYIAKINDYLSSTGKEPYSDYAATIRNWIRKDGVKKIPKDKYDPYAGLTPEEKLDWIRRRKADKEKFKDIVKEAHNE